MNALCSTKVSKKLKARLTLLPNNNHTRSNQTPTGLDINNSSSRENNHPNIEMIGLATVRSIKANNSRVSSTNSSSTMVVNCHQANGKAVKVESQSQSNHSNSNHHHVHYVQPPIIFQKRKGGNQGGGVISDVDIIRKSKSDRVPLNGLKDRVVLGTEANKETSRSTDDLLNEKRRPIIVTKKKCRPQSYAEPKKYRPLSYAEPLVVNGLVHNVSVSVHNGSQRTTTSSTATTNCTRGRFESCVSSSTASFNGHRIAELEARLTQLRIQQMHRRKSVDFAISCVEPDPTYFYVGQV